MFGRKKDSIKGVLFDLDGILLNTWPDMYRWYKTACEKHGKPFPYHSAEDLREVHTMRVVPDFYNFLGFDWEKDAKTLGEEYKEFRSHLHPLFISAMEDVVQRIDAHRIPLAVVSNTPKEETMRHLERLDAVGYFKAVVGPTPELKSKPKPDMLIEAARQLGIEPSKLIYVGDLPEDVEAARNAGMRSIGYFSFAGYAPLKSLEEAKPDILTTMPGKLLSTILDLAE